MAPSCGKAVFVEVKVTGAIFENFVLEILSPSLEVGDLVIWDNARIHTSRTVALVEAAGASVLPLPRYSPELNTIEPLWSKLKHYVREMRAGTVEKLREAFGVIESLTSASNIKAWIEQFGYLFNRLG